jgi:hypothetical protein
MKYAQVLYLSLAAWVFGCSYQPYILRDYEVGKSKEVTVGSVMMAWGEGRERLSSTGTSSTIELDVRRELLYSGIAQNVVHIGYREYREWNSTLVAAPAFYENLMYDISGSREIAFRDIKIEIEDANTQRVRFRVTQEPAVSHISTQFRTDVEEATDSLSAGGIGIKVDKTGKILQVAPSSPASKSGIVRGDVIYKIDGEPIPAHDAGAIVSKIHGEPGTEVRLEIARGSQLKEFNIVRRER